jgi:hypothetical protein
VIPWDVNSRPDKLGTIWNTGVGVGVGVTLTLGVGNGVSLGVGVGIGVGCGKVVIHALFIHDHVTVPTTTLLVKIVLFLKVDVDGKSGPMEVVNKIPANSIGVGHCVIIKRKYDTGVTVLTGNVLVPDAVHINREFDLASTFHVIASADPTSTKPVNMESA